MKQITMMPFAVENSADEKRINRMQWAYSFLFDPRSLSDIKAGDYSYRNLFEGAFEIAQPLFSGENGQTTLFMRSTLQTLRNCPLLKNASNSMRSPLHLLFTAVIVRASPSLSTRDRSRNSPLSKPSPMATVRCFREVRFPIRACSSTSTPRWSTSTSTPPNGK